MFIPDPGVKKAPDPGSGTLPVTKKKLKDASLNNNWAVTTI
jgi:hypothetical protein